MMNGVPGMDADQISSETKIEARAAEAAAIRRRWLTLGEMLAVAAVAISALTLWLNWSERSDTHAQKTAESTQAADRAATLTLGARPIDKGDTLELKPVSAEQQVQGQTIRFPAVLEIDPIETNGDPRIEARWFDDPLKIMRNRAGLPDDSRGDERLPVVITTRFLIDGRSHEDVALYDIGYTIKGRMFSGHVLALRGLSLVKHVKAGNAITELNSRAGRLLPAKG
jgi:hypothetical protein